MPDHTSHFTAAPASATAAEQRTHRFVGSLEKLADAATKMALDIAEAPREPGADPTISFQRAARTAYQAMQLAEKLARQAPPKPTAAERAADIRWVGRSKIIRAIGNAIQRECFTEREILSMHWELAERLDMPGTQRDIETRPINDVIQDIERDLGLDWVANANPWARRYPYHVQALYEMADEPSHPTGRPTQRRMEPFHTFRPFWEKPSETADPDEDGPQDPGHDIGPDDSGRDIRPEDSG